MTILTLILAFIAGPLAAFLFELLASIGVQ
jgi:hypothetical protein